MQRDSTLRGKSRSFVDFKEKEVSDKDDRKSAESGFAIRVDGNEWDLRMLVNQMLMNTVDLNDHNLRVIGAKLGFSVVELVMLITSKASYEDKKNLFLQMLFSKKHVDYAKYEAYLDV